MKDDQFQLICMLLSLLIRSVLYGKGADEKYITMLEKIEDEIKLMIND